MTAQKTIKRRRTRRDRFGYSADGQQWYGYDTRWTRDEAAQEADQQLGYLGDKVFTARFRGRAKSLVHFDVRTHTVTRKCKTCGAPMIFRPQGRFWECTQKEQHSYLELWRHFYRGHGVIT